MVTEARWEAVQPNKVLLLLSVRFGLANLAGALFDNTFLGLLAPARSAIDDQHNTYGEQHPP